MASEKASAPPDATGGFLGLARAPQSSDGATRPPTPRRPQNGRRDAGRATVEPSTPEPTLGAMVLTAVAELTAEGVVVTIPALSVRCWKLWPDRFGLGTTPHPDSARVSAEAAKLVALGLLSRPALGVLALTSPRGAR